jgi:hypothetical protein
MRSTCSYSSCDCGPITAMGQYAIVREDQQAMAVQVQLAHQGRWCSPTVRTMP